MTGQWRQWSGPCFCLTGNLRVDKIRKEAESVLNGFKRLLSGIEVKVFSEKSLICW